MRCRSHIRSGSVGVVAIAAVMVALSCMGSAIYLFEEPFNTPVGGIPDDWVVRWSGTSGPDNGVVEVTTYAGGTLTGLRQARTVGTGGAHGQNVVYYTGNSGDNGQGGYHVENGIFEDFHASVIFRIVSTYTYVLEGRAQALRYDHTSVGGVYGAAAYRTSSATGLYLVRNHATLQTAGQLDAVSLLPGVTGFTMAGNTDYRLDFSAVGLNLSAALYAWNTDDGDFTDLLASLSYTLDPDTDPIYTSGYVGTRYTTGGSSSAYSRDLQVAVIPEPGTLVLLLGAALAWGVRLRRGV